MNPLIKPIPHRLENLQLSELSFVSKPANVHCHVVMTKAAEFNPLMNVPAPIVTSRGDDAALAQGKPDASLDDEDAPMNFDQAVNDLAQRFPRHVAMQKARNAHPALFADYQAQGHEAIAKVVPQPICKSPAVSTFEKCVDRVQARDRCSRLVAFMKAAREHPAERDRYATS